MTTRDACLVKGVAERWPETWNRHARRGKRGEPVGERFELAERRMIEEGVTAVEQARDAAGFDVLRHSFGGVEIERSPGCVLAWKRRHGEDAVDAQIAHMPDARRLPPSSIEGQPGVDVMISTRSPTTSAVSSILVPVIVGFQANASRGWTISCDRGWATHSRAR